MKTVLQSISYGAAAMAFAAAAVPLSVAQNAAPATPVAQAESIPGLSALASGGINYSSRATVAKLDLVDATTRMAENYFLGLQISIAGIASSNSPGDALASQLLVRNNGTVNFYLSPLADSPLAWASWAKDLDDPSPVGGRALAPNRWYFDFEEVKSVVTGFLKDFYVHNDPNGSSAQYAPHYTTFPLDSNGKLQLSDPNKIHSDEFARDSDYVTKAWLDQDYVYITDGLGAKIYTRPQMPSQSGAGGTAAGATSANIYEGGGSAYAGLGVDGQIADAIQHAKGAWNLEAYVAWNTANRSILNSVFNVTNARSQFATGSLQASVSLGAFDFGVFYAVPLDATTRSFMKDMAGFSLSIQQVGSK